MRLHVLAACLLLAACGKSTDETKNAKAVARPTVVEKAISKEIQMASIGELTRPKRMDAKLRDATIVDPRLWPASLYSFFDGGSCTSTLVGSQVILTAAHCVSNGSTVDFAIGGRQYRAICEQAPGYPSDTSEDYALCAVNRPVTGVRFERINTDSNRIGPGWGLLLTGFGCITSGRTGGDDGVYRVGVVKVERMPSGSSNYIEARGEVALCFGNSGGPSFLEDGKARWQISVTSRINNGPGGVGLGKDTLLSSTSTPAAINFFVSWSRRNSLAICGIHSVAQDCR